MHLKITRGNKFRKKKERNIFIFVLWSEWEKAVAASVYPSSLWRAVKIKNNNNNNKPVAIFSPFSYYYVMNRWNLEQTKKKGNETAINKPRPTCKRRISSIEAADSLKLRDAYQKEKKKTKRPKKGKTHKGYKDGDPNERRSIKSEPIEFTHEPQITPKNEKEVNPFFFFFCVCYFDGLLF